MCRRRFDYPWAALLFAETDRVNGERCRRADPLMNDQDWALAFYLGGGQSH